MGESRTKKASRNIVIGIFSRLVTMLLAFITRTLFIQALGVEYNGVNGLYSNILAVLALSELGVGNVLNYALYSALQSNDTEKVKSLVCYFRKIYLGIAFAVSAIGVILIPFLQFIINSSLPHGELIIYYGLYLINSVVSYFVVYKTTVIVADQNNYISSVCDIITTIIMYIAQCMYLLLFKDFFGYLLIQVLCTILRNVLLNSITNKKYPYLKCLNNERTNLQKKEKDLIIDNIKSTFLYKIAAVILNNTDNILISIIVGTIYVGYYSNYYMVVNYITTFVSIFITGIMASLGNLNAENNKKASYEMFNILCLIFTFLGTAAMCCLINGFQPFIKIWIGQENVMDFSWVIVIALNQFLTMVMNPIWMFRETLGIFRQVRFILLITAGLNIVFSIVLGNIFGVPGILAATFLAKLVSQYWYEPMILFKKFHEPVLRFYFSQLKQIVTMLVAVAFSIILCDFIGDNIVGLFIRLIISVTIAILIVGLFNCKSEEMHQIQIRYIRPIIGRLLYRHGR